jgi:hypothetical protein
MLEGSWPGCLSDPARPPRATRTRAIDPNPTTLDVSLASAMKKTNCPCAQPSPTEEEIATIPGAQPGTALRVRVEPSVNGYVRLEHLAYSEDLGWYTQKSFCLPGEALGALVPALRKADCLIPRRPREADEPLRFPGPPINPEPHAPLRREA